MSPRLWPYFLKQAIWNMIKNRGVHALGLGTMVASLLIFGAFLLLFVNLDTWLRGWEHALSMTVYLDDGISNAQRNKVASMIKRIPGARIKRFISKADALEELRDALGPQSGLLDGLSTNPLPASFEVVFKGPEVAKTLSSQAMEKLKKTPGVEEVQFTREWQQRFDALMRMVRLVGFIIGGLLCLGVLFIVANTIKLAIYSRKDEIEILKLVGATDWFVKVPFLLEGLIQGILGGALSLLTLFLAYLLLATKKMQLLSFPILNFTFLPSEYVIALLIVSVLLGLVGSFIAVGRFFEL